MTTDAYQTVDLAAYCNAGVELLAGQQDPPVGRQVFHGLPFHIGAGQRAFVSFGPDLYQQPVTIQIGARAHAVIVAHRLLGSALSTGGPIGAAVANYTFRLA